MKIKILTVLLFLCFVSCKKKEVLPNKFIGTWYDTEYVIPNLSTIKINKDSSFAYNSAGCDWRTNSKGKWKIKGDSIELSSIVKDSCDKIFRFVDCSIFEIRKKNTNCNFSDITYFSKEIFYFKNDSLVYKLKKSSKCPDTLKIIFAKTPKIKKTRN